jgi:hypothetical protein
LYAIIHAHADIHEPTRKDVATMTAEATTRRILLRVVLLTMNATGLCCVAAPLDGMESQPTRSVSIRGIYGGVPTQFVERGKTLDDFGVNAIWVGTGGLNKHQVDSLKIKNPGLKVFAEFNSMHEASYLRDHPDAAPVGPDGARCPAPDGWQGVCPTHEGYRHSRMEAFRRALKDVPLDGIWLDYHHAHASWEQAEPNLPDTCFCPSCLRHFQQDTSVVLPESPTLELSRRLLGVERTSWVQWRCDVFTDWVREYRSILDEERPGAMLGTFHCPWSETDHDGGIRTKLAIDLKAQSRYLDVLSIMPYHARFGHADDPAWISRQTTSLARLLNIRGQPGERLQIWPIVQLSDWGKAVPVSQVREVLDQGTRPPATGVMVFVWGTLHPQWEKVEEMGRFFRSVRPR